MNSEQLVLALDDVRLKIPWSGRSPRDLTRGHEFIIFKAQGGVGDVFLESLGQLKLAIEQPALKKRGPSPRAPSLRPLPWEGGNHG